jgi:8-oxo-dGTP diphosphatase
MGIDRPKVGLGVIILKDGKILFGQRLNAHGEGSWCVPGGHIEFGESFAECARRETLEETSIKIKNIKFVTATNDVFAKENKHYITIYVEAEWVSGQPKVLEPQKMIEWNWYPRGKHPKPLFLPMQNLLKTGYKL